MQIVTRFAPSPTGFLHLGTARTALFNYLFTKHHGGRFLLRIEDTDRERSTQAACDEILASLSWLDIGWDGEVVYQAARQERHLAVAKALIEAGQAFYCYASAAMVEEARTHAITGGGVFRYHSPWRDLTPGQRPTLLPHHLPSERPVIRLRVPSSGETVVEDMIQGRVVFPNTQMDDMVLVRSDETPTYMLAVVVDDHDMAITHIIRGDDHLTNAGRQSLLYQALRWNIPQFAHMPLIHGPDGGKLSKRYGAAPVLSYRNAGFLPEAVCNALTRLGWAHGNDEVMDRATVIRYFDVKDIGRAPARFDPQKLLYLNGHYLRAMPMERYEQALRPFLQDHRAQAQGQSAHEALPHSVSLFSREHLQRIRKALPSIAKRASTLREAAALGWLYIAPVPLDMTEDAQRRVQACQGAVWIDALYTALTALSAWSQSEIRATVKAVWTAYGLAMSEGGPALRSALMGTLEAPDLFELMDIIGQTTSLKRLDAAWQCAPRGAKR